jgi:ADP-heptose:LPS heptosyltransferase
MLVTKIKSVKRYSKVIVDSISYKDDFKLISTFIIIDIANWILLFFKSLLFKSAEKECYSEIKKVLIFRTGSIGDTICSLPAIYNVRQNFPFATIDILTNAGNNLLVSMEALIDHSLYDSMIDYLGEDAFALWKRLRNKRYDMIIQLPQQYSSTFRQLRDMIFFSSAGIKYGIGWQKSSSVLFKRIQERYIIQKNEENILLELLERAGLRMIDRNIYPLNIDEKSKLYVKDKMMGMGIELNKPIIAIVIGAKRIQNRWPLSYFKEVIKELVKKNIQVLIIGGSEDTGNAALLAEQNVWNCTGLFTPIQSAIALSYCKMTISNDTGPMHLSYAVGTPVIAIFSSRDFPGRWYPPDNMNNHILRNNNVHCSLCLSENCSDNICMKAINPKRIIEILRRIN